MKTSALRRWLREERGRENVEALAEAIDTGILPGGERLRDVVDWASDPIGDFGGDLSSEVNGTFSNMPSMEPLTLEHLLAATREIERMKIAPMPPPVPTDEYRFRPMSFEPWPPLRRGHKLIDTGPSLRLPTEDGDDPDPKT